MVQSTGTKSEQDPIDAATMLAYDFPPGSPQRRVLFDVADLAQMQGHRLERALAKLDEACSIIAKAYGIRAGAGLTDAERARALELAKRIPGFTPKPEGEP